MSTLNHSEREHSRISPSGLKSLQVCPGYQSDGKENAASKRGTSLHEIMELGKIPDNCTLPPEDIAVANQVLELLKEIDAQSEYEPIVEILVRYDALKLKDFEQGHIDRVLVLDTNPEGEPTKLELVDFKFGQWEVDSLHENIQFRAYALGLFLQFPAVQVIRLRLVQPALNINTTYDLTRSKDYELIVTQVKSIVKRKHHYDETKDASMLKPESQCAFCAAQATCKKWQEHMVRVANESNFLGTQVVPIEKVDDPYSAEPNEVVRIFRWIKPMEDYLKKVKKLALACYDNGRFSDEFTLIEKSGDVTVVDPILARDLLQQHYGIDPMEYLASCEISLTKIRELVGAKASQGNKGKDQEEAIKLLSDNGIIQYGPEIRYVQLSRKRK
jgi:hypothetical protein